MAPDVHDESDRATPSRIPSGVWVLGVVSLLMDVSSEMIHSLLPLFMVTTLGVGAFAVGVIEGLAESTALIVKIFSGALSDYLGKRKGLAVFGYALGALTKPLFAIAPTAGVVLTARLLDRVGQGRARRAARRAGRGHHAARRARGGLRPAPVARHRGRLHRPARWRPADAAVGRRLPGGVLGGRDPRG